MNIGRKLQITRRPAKWSAIFYPIDMDVLFALESNAAGMILNQSTGMCLTAGMLTFVGKKREKWKRLSSYYGSWVYKNPAGMPRSITLYGEGVLVDTETLQSWALMLEDKLNDKDGKSPPQRQFNSFLHNKEDT